MKQNTKKISLLTLAAIGTMTLGLGVTALNAKAADDALTTIAMAPGASVRLGATDGENTYNGIRFVAELNNYSEANEYSYGMIIVPFDYVTTYADAIAALDGDIIAAAQAGGIEIVNLKCLPVFGDGDMDGDEEWFIQGSLVEILPENLNRKFVGIGYFNDGEAYTYAQVNEADNARSISYVASKVIHGYTNDVASETDPYDVCLNYAYGGIGGSEFAITADASVELIKGASKKLTVAQAPAMDYFVAFESANNAVATVSADGTVTAVGVGETKILVKCVDKVVEVPVTVSLDWAKINYDFSSASDMDATAVVTTHSNVVINGMVEDTAASDGWAFKFINPTSSHVGVKVLFNDLDTSKYQSIKLRLKSVNSNPSYGHSSVYVNSDSTNNDLNAHWGKTNGYLDIDILSKAGAKLSFVYIGIDNRPNTEFYIDGFTFVEKPDISKCDYNFSSLDDNDILAVSAGAGATVVGMVAVDGATDGYAAQVTACGTAGMVVSFNDIDVSKYASITLRFKSSNGYSLNINGTYVKYSGGTAWEEVELISLMSGKDMITLSNISFWRGNGGTHQCYVDSITFVEKKSYNYDFSSADDFDIEACVAVSNEAIVMVEDAAAEDGWAVKCTIADGNGGLEIKFDALDVSKYSQIIVRVKTGTHVNLNLNGTYCDYVSYSQYTEVDLIPYLTQKDITTLNSVSFTRNVNQGIWVDWVKFVPAN